MSEKLQYEDRAKPVARVDVCWESEANGHRYTVTRVITSVGKPNEETLACVTRLVENGIVR